MRKPFIALLLAGRAAVAHAEPSPMDVNIELIGEGIVRFGDHACESKAGASQVCWWKVPDKIWVNARAEPGPGMVLKAWEASACANPPQPVCSKQAVFTGKYPFLRAVFMPWPETVLAKLDIYARGARIEVGEPGTRGFQVCAYDTIKGRNYKDFCAVRLPYGQLTRFRVVPDQQTTFTGWTNTSPQSCPQPVCMIKATQDFVLRANITTNVKYQQLAITHTDAPGAKVLLTVTPDSEVSCKAATCSRFYPTGTKVVLVARKLNSATGLPMPFDFGAFPAVDCGPGDDPKANVCTVVMDKARSVLVKN